MRMRGLGTGLGIVFGAGVGMLLALTVFEAEVWMGLLSGAALGLLVGAVWDAQGHGTPRDGDAD
ncbi:MAG TPA: hypothetical protein VK906_01805 [Egicoccus sp.]|nr:hypothetical protein [Egicoccus sp.]HSK21876.1 hypothetical protein [Egicoccus sp.]